jgi:hypothetical protein
VVTASQLVVYVARSTALASSLPSSPAAGHHSQYFNEETPINGEHRKVKDGRIDLPDEDPGAFELLVKWLYQGKIEDVSTLPIDKKWDYADCCQKLYLLCDKLHLPRLKNIAIDQFRKGCHEAGLVPGPEEMKPIYQKTVPSSPFRKLVSKIAARQLMDPEGKRDASTYRACFEATPDFAIDVINAIKDGTSGVLFDDPTEGNSCRYHEHENGETCHKTVKFKEGS